MKTFTFGFLKLFLSTIIAFCMVSVVAAQHDLELLKSASSTTAEVGDQVTFSLIVNNDAATTVTNVEVTDLLPPGVVYVSHLPVVENYDPLTGIWDLGTILSTTTARNLEIVVEIIEDGVIFNTAEITAMDGADFDSTPNNGVVWEDDYASACVSVLMEMDCGSSVTLTAEPGFTGYQWYKNGSILVGETNQTLTVSETGSYSYTTDDVASGCPVGLCCPVLVEFGSDLLPPPVVNPPGTNEICEGQSLPLSALDGSTNLPYAIPVSYQWYKNFIAVPGPAGTQSILVADEAGIYHVEVTDGSGCSNVSNYVELIVNPLPQVDVVDLPQDECLGSTFSFSVVDNPDYTISWELREYSGIIQTATQPFSGAGPHNFSFSDELNDNYQLALTVTDNNTGCVWSNIFSGSILSVPEITLGEPFTLCEGTCGTLSIATTDGSPFPPIESIEWGGSPINIAPDSMSAEVCPPSTPSGSTYTYDVLVTFSNGCTKAASVEVELLPSLEVNAGEDQIVCEDSEAIVTATNIVGATYNWTQVSGPSLATIESPDAFQTNITDLSAGEYIFEISVSVTGDNGTCTDTDQVKITAIANPIVTIIPEEQDVCFDESITLAASLDPSTPTPATFFWSSTDDPSLSFLNCNPCAAPILNIPSTYVGNSITYLVTAVVTGDNGIVCTGTDEVTITINAAQTLSIAPSYTICDGSCAPISVTSDKTIAEVLWTGGPLNNPMNANTLACPPGASQGVVSYQYTASVTDTDGCVAEATTNVNVTPSIEVYAGEDQTFCEGSTADLSASTNLNSSFINGTISVSWSESPSNPSSGANLATTAGYTVQTNVLSPGTYAFIATVTQVSPNGISNCSSTDVVQIIVTENPIVNINASNNGICAGGSLPVLLTAELANMTPAAASYFWSSSDDPGLNFLSCSACETTVLTVPANYVGTTISYTVTAYVTTANNQECTGSAVITIDVNAPPALSISAPGYICDGSCAELSIASTTPIQSVLWNGGGGPINNPTALNPVVCPAGSTQGETVYTYSVEVTDINGCIANASTSVTVTPGITVYAGEDQTVCEESIVALEATTNLTSSVNNGFIEVNWTESLANPNTGSNLASASGYMVQTNPLQEGVYEFIATVTQFSPDGTPQCTNQDVVQITVADNPMAIIISSEPDICQDGQESVTLAATLSPTSPAPATFYWSSADDPALAFLSCSVCEAPVLTIPNGYPFPTITYTVTAVVTTDNNMECTTTTDITLDVLPALFIDPIDEVTVCDEYNPVTEQRSTTLRELLSGDPVDIGSWTITPMIGISNVLINGSTITFDVTPSNAIVEHEVSLTSVDGCYTSTQFFAYENPRPEVSFRMDDYACLGSVTSIWFTGNAGPAANYFWDFAGATVVYSDDANPYDGIPEGPGPHDVVWNAYPPFGNTYEVSLVVEDGGCIESTIDDIIIERGFDVVWDVQPATACNTNDGIISLVSAIEHLSGNDISSDIVLTWSGPNGFNLQGSCANACNLTGLEPGTYYVRVDDSDGCFYNYTLDVQAPNNLGLNALVGYNVNCGMSNGAIHVELVDGTSPYTYSFYDENNNLVATETSSEAFFTQDELPAGNYTVIAVDANSCEASGTIMLDAIEGPEVSIDNVVATACGLAEGEITFTAIGLAPFTYELYGASPLPGGNIGGSGIPTTIGFLPVGTYFLKVTDATGCSTIIDFTIEGLDPGFVVDVTSIDGTCPFGSNGAPMPPVGAFIVNQPIGAFTYTWLDTEGNALSPVDPLNPTGLANGCYTLIVSDGICSDTVSLTLNPANGPVITPLFSADASCPDANNGIVSFLASGEGPLQYNIHNISSQDGLVMSGTALNGVPIDLFTLAEGTYRLVVRDRYNCESFYKFEIGDPVHFTIHVDQDPGTCGAQDGQACITIFGGAGTIYDVQINPTVMSPGIWTEGNEDCVFGLGAVSTYGVTVTDLNDCIATFDLGGAPELLADITLEAPVACYNPNSGSILVSVPNPNITDEVITIFDAAYNDVTAMSNGMLAEGVYYIDIIAAGGACTFTDTVELIKDDCFDLALRKTSDVNMLLPGQEVEFSITVFNQGEIPAYDVLISDYLPIGLSLSVGDVNGWTALAGNVYTNEISEILPGDSTSISLLAIVENNPPFGPAINIGEISFATQIDGSGIPSDDFDSTPDTNPDNDTGGTPEDPNEDDVISDDGTIDEDDADPAQIEIVEPGAIGDWVWNDINENGKQDLGEPGIGGVDVTLYDAVTNLPLAFTTTDITGYYEFTGLYPMANYVIFDHGTAPNNFLPTMQDAQANTMDAMDSDADPITGQTQIINLGPGEFNNTIDAGYYELESGIIEGVAWIDCNKNGLREPGEDLLAEVPVMLIGTTIDGMPVNESTLTDLSGYYLFDPVFEGAYSVKFGYPASIGGLQITDQDAGSDQIDSDVDPLTGVTLPFTLLPGDTLTFDAGYQDVEGPQIFPKDPALTGVNNGDTLTFECNEAPVLDGNLVMVMDNVDPDPEVVFIERFEGRGNCATTGYLMLMKCGWVATDTCGNVSEWFVYVKIVDTEPPVLSGVPADTMVTCENIPAPPLVTATDICDNAVDIDMTETTSTGGCPYTIIRVWTATDDCGNFTTGEQVITVTDEVAPVITSIPPDTTVNCGEVPVFDPNRVLAIDNCDLDLSITASDSLDDTSCPYTLYRTITVEDNCGNTDMQTRVITIVDAILPEFTFVPSDTTIECTEIVPQLPNAIAIDACDDELEMTVTVDTIPGGCPQETIYYYTWTAEDDCGNLATANASVVIIDSTAPEFANIPADVAIDCTELLPDGLPDILDNCDPFPQLSVQIDTVSVIDCETTILRTFTASDACGNESNTAQTIVVSDNFAPIIILTDTLLIGYGDGDTIDISCDNVPEFDTSAIKAIDNCDPNVTVTFEDLASTQGDCLVDGYLFLMYCRWTAVDDCGNTTTFTIYLRVIDDEAPVLTGVPGDLSLSCEGDIPDPAVVGVDDNCDPDVNVDFTELIQGDDCGAGIQILRIWSATDHCGNSTSASQVISVLDEEAPVFTGVPDDMLINCNDSIPVIPVVSAIDNCDDQVDIAYEEEDLGGDCATTGRNIRRIWTATDDCGNQATASQMITILDTIPPVLVNVPGDLFLECPDNIPPPAPVSVRDNCGQPITLDFREENLGGTCATGIRIRRTWTGTDACGNTNIQSQLIIIQDSIAPVMSGVPDNVTLTCNDPIPGIANVTATDNCDPNIIVQFEEEDLGGNCRTGRAFRRIWSATDACGNTTSDSQLITILPDEAPSLVGVPADETVACAADIPVPPTVTAVDDCSINLNVLFEEETLGGDCATGYEIQRTWSVEDDCGNLVTDSQIITVLPDEAPVLNGVPADMVVDCIDQVPSPAVVTATDLCTPNIQVQYTEVNLGGTCLIGIQLLRTWSATDACGNTVSASQTISIRADEPPVLNGVPAHTTVSCIDDIPTPPVVTATDLCSPVVNVTFTETDLGGDCSIGRLIQREWSATDDCGNTTTGSQLITIAGDEPPVLNGVPADTTITCANDLPVPPLVTASDVCSPQVDVIFEEIDLGGDCASGRQVQRIWTATDDCGNTTSAAQMITIAGDEPPVLSGVPNNLTVTCATDIPNPPVVTATDVCSGILSVEFDEEDLGGDCATGRQFLRTWTATDDCGNATSATQLITVLGDEPPVLTGVPGNISVNCADDVPPPANVFATDVCSPVVDVVYTQIDLGGDCATGKQLLRTWTASDDCGNITSATQLITISGDEPPVLSSVPNNLTVGCIGDVPPPAVVTATDICSPNVSVVFEEIDLGGDCVTGRQFERIWTATDDCGNTTVASQIITVLPDEAPLLSGVPADITIACQDDLPPPAIVTATDFCTPSIQVLFVENDLGGDCANGRLIERIWSATDACGNTTTASQLITIDPDNPPVLVGVPVDLTLTCGEPVPNPPVVTADDLCSSNLQVVFTEIDLGGDCLNGSLIERTWTATDDCGNTTTATQTITIQGDDQAPVLSGVPADVIIACGDIVPAPAIVSASDFCDDDVPVVFAETDLGGDCLNGRQLLRTWTATDDCGNTTSDTQLITIQGDDLPPVLSGVPADTTISCNGLLPVPPMVTGSDLCSPNVPVVFEEEDLGGDCGTGRQIVRTWTATDDCGNTSSASQLITLIDNIAPIISGVPGPVTLNCEEDLPPPANVTAADNCPAPVDIAYMQEDLGGDCMTGHEFLRTWTATDACGNQSSATQLLTIIDNTPPNILVSFTFQSVECGTPINIPTPITNDNCDGPIDLTFSDRTIDGPCPQAYTFIRTYTATDACGNETTRNVTVNVSDNSAPILDGIPTDTTIYLGQGQTIPLPPNVSASDSCDMSVPVRLAETRLTTGCDYTLLRTWTATDDCGNMVSATQLITVIGETLDLTFVSNNPGCAMNDGSITVNIQGGTQPYGFLWSNGATSQTISGLVEGTYSVTVNDNNGCSAVGEVTLVSQAYDLSLTLTSFPSDCDVATGEATVSASGGTGPYMFLWETGDTSSTIFNLPSGIYSVTATDANGCSGIDSVEVTEFLADFSFLVFPTNEFCSQSDGTASVQASGGVAPYTYNWSNGASGPFITGLTAGVYQVTATDAIGCSDTSSVVIINECPCTTPALEKLTVLPAGCPDDNGEATIEVVGDEADYTYTWMPDIGIPNANNNMRTGLPSGNYTVLVRHLGDPNCELPVDFAVAFDCNATPCDTILVLEQLFVPSNTGTESICLPTSGELTVYDVTLDGMLLSQPFDSCGNDTTIYYSYALLAGGGQMGPYTVDIWNGNGTNLNNVVVNDMAELAGLMNGVDPDGNWVNDYGSKILSGGDPQGTYGDLVITINMNTLTMPVNTTIVPIGDAITVSGLGDHLVVATDPNSGCADTLTITITNAGLPPDFIKEDFEIMQANCEDGEPVYCVKDIAWTEMDDYALTVNGYPYDRFTGTCNYDFNHAYSYFTVPGLAQNGPYAVDAWMVAGVSHDGTFDNPQELVTWMNQTDPDGDWQLDATSFSITSEGNVNDHYGNLHITQLGSGSMANLEINTNFIPRDLGVSLKPGMNELIFERLADGVTDTVIVGVACISPEYLQDRIKLGKMDTICLNTDQLLGEVVSIDNVCIDGMGAASFDIISGTNCFTCTGMSLGDAEACMVICDEYGICDTTYLNVLVVPDVKTRAITDTARTSIRNMVVVNPSGNDIYNGTVSDVIVKDPPRYGSVHVNEDMTISYMPFEEWCNNDEPDMFRYEVCTTEGGCDDGMVYIFVDCGEIIVYNGFSPNGDGINETLRIDGLHEFPNHKLTVFNRWGMKVFEAQQYQNDWDGTYRGEPLPDGTYFFVIDNGEGNISNGYLEIHR